MLLRFSFETGENWAKVLGIVILYLIALIIIYLIISKTIFIAKKLC